MSLANVVDTGYDINVVKDNLVYAGYFQVKPVQGSKQTYCDIFVPVPGIKANARVIIGFCGAAATSSTGLLNALILTAGYPAQYQFNPQKIPRPSIQVGKGFTITMNFISGLTLGEQYPNCAARYSYLVVQ